MQDKTVKKIHFWVSIIGFYFLCKIAIFIIKLLAFVYVAINAPEYLQELIQYLKY